MALSRVVSEILNVQKCRDLEIRVRGLKVIGTDTYRCATYDFLLMFHSNYWPNSQRFRDKWQFQLKIANFPHPRVFCAPSELRVAL